MKRFSLAMTWLALAGLMTMISCRKPVIGFSGDGRAVTISAVTESGNGSKTAIEGLKVNWSEGDVISMNGCELTLKEGAGTTEGVFEGTVTGEAPYYVGYPAGATTHEGATLKLNIPATMTYEAGKVAVPMVAVTSSVEGGLEFHNAVNMLKLQLKGDGTDASRLTSIVLTSTTSNLNGKINVTFNGETPEFAAIDGDGASKTMTVNFSNGGLQLGNTVQCVYIPLAKINGGVLTVRFNCANGKYMEKKVNVTTDFNEVNNMLDGELTVYATDKEYEYVDLGLPNGTLWATCNVGADSPEEYGDYFAWGATTTWYSSLSPLTWKSGYESGYVWATCPGNGENPKYNATSFNTWKSGNLADGVLKPAVDVAHVNWGGDWRMPTTEEWKALYDNTTSTWVTSYKGKSVSGRLFKSKNDDSKELFLPAAGNVGSGTFYDLGSQGHYWSSSLYSSNEKAYLTTLREAGDLSSNNTGRFVGCTVRPVR